MNTIKELLCSDTAEDIKEQYLKLKYEGLDDSEIERELSDANADLLSDVDDYACFWLAVASMQYQYGEPTENMKIAINCMSHMENSILATHGGDNELIWNYLTNLKKKQLRKKAQKSFLLAWEIGDVFCYSPAIYEKNEEDKVWLIHKVDEFQDNDEIYPIVMIKVIDKTQIPNTKEDFDLLEYSIILEEIYDVLDLQFRPQSRECTVEEYREGIMKIKENLVFDEIGRLPIYRYRIYADNLKSMPSSMRYIGNFTDTKMPVGEYIPPKWSIGVPLGVMTRNRKTFETRLAYFMEQSKKLRNKI